MKNLSFLLLACALLVPEASAQTSTRSAVACPVLPSIASAKRHSEKGDLIVIWYWNQSKSTIRGAQFEIVLLDGVANRYAGYGPYIAEGEVRPQNGDVVDYPAKREEDQLGDTWSLIEGVEVRVTRVLFKDGSVWVPRKGQVCKGTYMNEDYDAEMDRRWKRAEAGQQKESGANKNQQ